MTMELGDLALSSKKKVNMIFAWAINFFKNNAAQQIVFSSFRLFNIGIKVVHLEFKLTICDGMEDIACDIIHMKILKSFSCV